MEFKFPVSVIVGENGIGKSTFIRAAACAYSNDDKSKILYPSNLFVKTQWDSSSVDNAVIDYKIKQGSQNIKNARWKKTKEWGYKPKNNKPKRNVYFLDVSRTLPLDATVGYAKIAKQSIKDGINVTTLTDDSVNELSYTLGKPYSSARFTSTEISDKEVGLLTSTAGEISQFHQGAGEDATLDLFKLLQEIRPQSLLIIDELEASLHPQAQRRLTRYLLKYARINKIQIILSTHSPYVLNEIPPEGRIFLQQLKDTKNIMYGVTTNFALSSMDELDHPDLYIFVEDHEAKKLITQIIKLEEGCEEILRRVKIMPLGSYTTLKTINELLTANKLPHKGIAIVDGDKSQECANCLHIHGNLPPEIMIMQDLQKENWKDLEGRFGIGAGSLYKILNDAMILPDHHKWTEYIGDNIKESKDYVWRILVEEWCKQCLSKYEEDNSQLISAIKEALE
ncbi:putative ATPase [Methanococcus maripaludis]|uniref:Putative ATPase n=2 Tax=Methanococcus maripaludis TaxID=39152 RepID=A0A7J9NT33_METMI|nr:putative ATPase [Methanococcus maripaludis]